MLEYHHNRKYTCTYFESGLHDGDNFSMDFSKPLLGGGAMLELLRLKLVSFVHPLPVQSNQEDLTDATTARANVTIGGLVVLNDGTDLV